MPKIVSKLFKIGKILRKKKSNADKDCFVWKKYNTKCYWIWCEIIVDYYIGS